MISLVERLTNAATEKASDAISSCIALHYFDFSMQLVEGCACYCRAKPFFFGWGPSLARTGCIYR